MSRTKITDVKQSYIRPVDVIDEKSDRELLEVVIAETAKAANELTCAQQDLDKAHGRLGFNLVLLHRLRDRLAETKD